MAALASSTEHRSRVRDRCSVRRESCGRSGTLAHMTARILRSSRARNADRRTEIGRFDKQVGAADRAHRCRVIERGFCRQRHERHDGKAGSAHQPAWRCPCPSRRPIPSPTIRHRARRQVQALPERFHLHRSARARREYDVNAGDGLHALSELQQLSFAARKQSEPGTGSRGGSATAPGPPPFPATPNTHLPSLGNPHRSNTRVVFGGRGGPRPPRRGAPGRAGPRNPPQTTPPHQLRKGAGLPPPHPPPQSLQPPP